MTYTTKKCPHCKYPYQIRETSNYRYGSPIMTCPLCQQTFIDKDRHEIALEEEYNESQFNVGACFLSAFFPCGLSFIIFFILTLCSEEISGLGIAMCIFSLIAFIVIFVVGIKDLPNTIKIYKQEYEESKKRLKNPAYIQELIKLGYDIPPQYNVSNSTIYPLDLYIEALRIVIISNKASIPLIQHKLSINYEQAKIIIEWMEYLGYITSFDGVNERQVLITQKEFEDKFDLLYK